jgi:hypothetical protein
MAMMSLKDADHVVRLDGYKLARRIHLEPDLVLKALEVLKNPDLRRPGQEYDGRRIELVEDGWLILNGEKYREKVSDEMRKARNRRAQESWRKRQKEIKRGKPLTGEAAALRASAAGDEAGADQIAAERRGMPDPGGLSEAVRATMIRTALENGDEVTLQMLEKAGVKLDDFRENGGGQ